MKRGPLPGLLLPIGAAAAMGVFSPSPLGAQSELWGAAGESWSPGSLLPEFSFAGYRQGDEALPHPEAHVSVTDFGAVGDGQRDCTAAFLRAIAESPGKVIRIPKGIYRLNDRLELTEPNTVLLGDGSGETVLWFQRGLQEIEPTTAVTGGGLATNKWSWSGGIITLGQSLRGSGEGVGVVSPAQRGQRGLEVADASGFAAGDLVLLQVQDDSEHSLLSYLYRGRPGDLSRIPGGQFSLSQALKVAKVEGRKLTLEQSLRFDVRPEWTPQLGKISHPSRDMGIAGLTIRFPERPYRGHWMEDGMNGLAIYGVNQWARDIRIENADSGLFLTGYWCSVRGLVLDSRRPAHESGYQGHHGITVTGWECLLQDFKVNTKYFHDLTVSSGSVGNVFSRGSGVDLALDHHRRAPYENLFTQIHVGEATRVWVSGGSRGLGLHSASGGTFWNLDSKKRFSLPDEEFGPPGLIFVGLNAEAPKGVAKTAGWHYESIRPGALQPPNLHEAQLAKRKGSSSRIETKETFRQWTNLEGQSIEALFLHADEKNVRLQTRDGRAFDYPLDRLSLESRDAVRRLAKGSEAPEGTAAEGVHSGR